MTDDYVTDGPEAEPAAGAGSAQRAKKKKPARVFVDPDVEDCPVIPLGYEGRDVLFALPGGELRQEPARNIASMMKTDMFVCYAGRQFLANWVDDDGEFKAQAAAIWFNATCRDVGKWDRNRPVRGYGVWPSPKGPMLHAGDALGHHPFGEHDWTPIATALRAGGRGPVWKLCPPAPRPGKAASRAEGEKLRRYMDMWRWHELAKGGLTGADVALGWQGMALLGACAPFRAHILVIGGFGCGKTTLSMLMQAAGSANAGDLLDRFTEAGARGEISGEARALYLDEAEPSADGPGPVEKAMEMLRRMATGDGSKGVQSGINGQTVHQTAIGAAWLGAINAVEPGAAMASRLVEVRLRPLGTAKGGATTDLTKAIDWARSTSSAFLSRAMRDHGRYLSDVSVMREALGETGETPRGADLIAALAAGRRLLLFDEAMTIEDARVELVLWEPLIEHREQTSSSVNPGQACLARIFALNSGQHSHDRHLTIGEMVQEEARCRGTYDRVLKTFGLRIENSPPGAEMPGPWLWVSNNHPTLARALKDTEYRNWRAALDHLVDLGEGFAPRTLDKSPKFGMHQSRALAVPLTPWLEGPVGVGADPREESPFVAPVWNRSSPVSSPEASPRQTHD